MSDDGFMVLWECDRFSWDYILILYKTAEHLQ